VRTAGRSLARARSAGRDGPAGPPAFASIGAASSLRVRPEFPSVTPLRPALAPAVAERHDVLIGNTVVAAGTAWLARALGDKELR
jgi:hypothetical protein